MSLPKTLMLQYGDAPRNQNHILEMIGTNNQIKPKIRKQVPSVKRLSCSVDIGWHSLYLHIFQSDLAFSEILVRGGGKSLAPRSGTVVLGGGAAGMMAAIRAAECGEQVILLEANQQLGRKILISGNGRCNLTNLEADAEVHYHGGNPQFRRRVLGQYTLRNTLDFFGGLGVVTREEKRGRLFPLSDQAQSIVDVLEDRLQILGVRIYKNVKVCGLTKGKFFNFHTRDGSRFVAERAIMASGGVSLAKLGADRSGLDLAIGLGHTSSSLYPGLVPLNSPEKYIYKMHGVKVRAQVRASLRKGRYIEDIDDLLFTKYGVSGFTILNLSAQLVPLLDKGPLELEINLFPGRVPEQLSEMLKIRWQDNPHRSLAKSFSGLLSSKLIGPLLEKLELPLDRPVAKISKVQRWYLARTLCSWLVGVDRPRSFEQAEVTIGGIDTGEINPDTLESYLVPGLYFAGEMVDVHADLGGFNFQWAWSSGHLAGSRLGS